MDYIDGRVTGVGSINEVLEEVQELKTSKLDLLVSGINIKTVNNIPITGSGNVSISGTSALTSDLTVTTTIGGITAGTTYSAGTSLETIIRALLTPAENMYWGATFDVPTAIGSDFEAEACPSDLQTTGAKHSFTTYTEGEERGKHCIYAYPTHYGDLTKIFVTEFPAVNLLEAWTKISVTYNNTAYNLYYANATTKDRGTEYNYNFVIG